MHDMSTLILVMWLFFPPKSLHEKRMGTKAWFEVDGYIELHTLYIKGKIYFNINNVFLQTERKKQTAWNSVSKVPTSDGSISILLVGTVIQSQNDWADKKHPNLYYICNILWKIQITENKIASWVNEEKPCHFGASLS